MPAIFLSHASIDKPFVEKLAKDLNALGISVWYDKYEIKPGETILLKIEEGIQSSDYLGLVISKEAMESKWVLTEITSAWQKQVEKGYFVVPIYYRDCEIPLFLQGIKYADFRTDYKQGFEDLVKVFGIRDLEAITADNWRKFTRKRNERWKEFRDLEFESLITGVCKIARQYHFGVWVGRSKSPYSFIVRGSVSRAHTLSIAVRMDPGKSYRYLATDTDEYNPNYVAKDDYHMEIGSTVNEVEEYLSRRMEEFVAVHGLPTEEPHYFTDKKLDMDATIAGIMALLRKNDWDQGQ